MKIQPFGERVAVQVIPVKEVTKGGLIIETVSKDNSNRGVIVALGEGAPECFKVGDKVVFNKGAGLTYTDGSEDFRVVSTKDVLCKIVED